ncbi:MAG: hypothetical protein ACI35R_13055 [Bacillus sp. (in: firmicutes)]
MIQKVTLKDMKVVEIEGEFHQVYENEEVLPCVLTNYALKKGEEEGLISASIISSLIDLMPGGKLENIEGENIDSDVVKNMDTTNMQKTIYLGCLGARPGLQMDFDTFLQRYHASFDEVVETYMNIIMAALQSSNSSLAKGLAKSTKKEAKKKLNRRS